MYISFLEIQCFYKSQQISCKSQTGSVIHVAFLWWCSLGLLIEMWKVTKVVEIKIDQHNMIAGVLPKISFIDRPSYQSSTKKYDMVWFTFQLTMTVHLLRDSLLWKQLLIANTCILLWQMAFKYLGMVLFPLFIGYGVYSLFYLEHKGWYSFVLSMCYGFLLTFGELVMNNFLAESAAVCHFTYHSHGALFLLDCDKYSRYSYPTSHYMYGLESSRTLNTIWTW